MLVLTFQTPCLDWCFNIKILLKLTVRVSRKYEYKKSESISELAFLLVFYEELNQVSIDVLF